MSTPNPYTSPIEPPKRTVVRGPANRIGTIILAMGLVVLAYGALGFWVINSLPPNGGANGRLPSLYIMGVGILVSLAGMSVRDVRFGRGDHARHPKGIPTSVGLLCLFAILFLVFVVISRL